MSAVSIVCHSPAKLLLPIFGLLGVGAVTACHPGAHTDEMVIPVAANQFAIESLPIKAAITVGTVSGGHETYPFLPADVSNDSLKAALDASLVQTGLKGPPGAPYMLNAQLVKLDRPFMGVNLTVTGTAQYSLFLNGQAAPVWSQTVVTPYTASFLEASDATQRLLFAEEGAMRNNIQELIARLIADSRPGGSLGKAP